jgi:hypothetical protein
MTKRYRGLPAVPPRERPALRLVGPDERPSPIKRRGPYKVVRVPGDKSVDHFVIEPSWGSRFGWFFSEASATEFVARLVDK